jgi:hypothetical protein
MLTQPQKYFDCKNPLYNSRFDFLGSKQHSPHWLSSKGPNYQRGILLMSAGTIGGHFDGKTPQEVHQYGLFLHDNARLTGNLQTIRNWSTCASRFLITHSIFRIRPRRTTTCSLDWKKQLKCLHFSSDSNVNAAAKTWLVGQYFEFF